MVGERTRDLVDLAFASQPSVHGLKSPHFFVDLSQGAERAPWSTHVRSIVQHSLIYSYKADRTLCPEEMLRLLGFDDHRLQFKIGLSAGQLRSMAGQAMAVPSIGLVLVAVCRALPIWEEQSSQTT